jgi:hypothetical protein
LRLFDGGCPVFIFLKRICVSEISVDEFEDDSQGNPLSSLKGKSAFKSLRDSSRLARNDRTFDEPHRNAERVRLLFAKIAVQFACARGNLAAQPFS